MQKKKKVIGITRIRFLLWKNKSSKNLRFDPFITTGYNQPMKNEIQVPQVGVFYHDWRLDRMYKILREQNFPQPTSDQRFELDAIEKMIQKADRGEVRKLVTKRVIGYGIAVAAAGLAFLFGEAARIDATADIGWFGDEAGRIARVNQDRIFQISELVGTAIVTAYTYFIVGQDSKIKREILADQRKEVIYLRKA